jgi:hypothetical protein
MVIASVLIMILLFILLSIHMQRWDIANTYKPSALQTLNIHCLIIFGACGEVSEVYVISRTT